MSTSHSLAYSPSSPSPVHVKRHSGSGQLPLPPTLSSTTQSQRTTQSSNPPAGANGTIGTNSSLHTRAPSLTASSRATHIESVFHQPGSPTTTHFPPIQLVTTHHTGSTHAGGIQPPASFFRPARPSDQPQFSRPSTSRSSSPVPVDADIFPLASLSKQVSNSSEERSPSAAGVHDITLEDQQQDSMKRPKHSRDPLLPITSRPHGRERSATVATPTPPNRSATSRVVRTSLDKVFNIGRGLSFDGGRKSTSSRPFHLGDGRFTMDGKPIDEERGEMQNGRVSLSTFSNANINARNPASPTMQFGPSLGVSVDGHSPHPSRPSSPDLSYNPTPYVQDPPLSAIPIINPKTGKPVRNYERHPSRNRFFLGGHLLTGGDSSWAFVASFTLLLTIAGIWFGTTCVWWWQNESIAVAIVGVYMSLLTISSMLATATTDPGILPRNLDPDPPHTQTASTEDSSVPMPRDLKVRSDVVRVKYCPTCKTYRPPRSSHCKMCDNCVDGCDHHCQWVNNCVGRRNYTSFIVLLSSATTTLILVICTAALHLWFLTQRENINFRTALGRGWGSAVVFCLSIVVIWPVAALLSYHMRLLLLNITTIEQIRNQAHKSLIPGPAPPNPFSHGNWRKNVLIGLCRPVGPSWLNASGIATEDKREINPGMLEAIPWMGESGRP
ncbi:hypothetical protein AX16_001596 [Volvariella volvacea WC 439]|nr:hypothetical protein AX16_001596 [Volvariella volvacea WC 439]